MASADPMLDAVAFWRAANRVLCAACETFEDGPVVEACLDADRAALRAVFDATAETSEGWTALCNLLGGTTGEVPMQSMFDCLERSHRAIFAGQDGPPF